MSAIRILHVTPDLVPYGLENMIAGLVRSLDRRRFEPAVVSLYDESAGGLEPEMRSQGIRVFHLGKRRGLDLRMYPRLLRVLREFRPDVLHTHNYVLRYAWPVARMAGTPAVVHTVHNVADREVDRAGQMLQSYAFRSGVRAVSIAEEVSASFRRTYGFAEAAMIPNGIDVERYAAPAVSRSAWRRAAGIPENDFVYLCVARFASQKDHETLLRAFAQGPALRPGTRLALAGDGELRTDVERLAGILGIAERITFLGRRTDVPEVLAAADAFVLASRWEGNPLSVMEAMAAGLPIVATAVGAIPELMRHGIDGLLSPAGDAGALAHSMNTPDLAALGRSGAARARERFSLTAMTRAYSELYCNSLPSRSFVGSAPSSSPQRRKVLLLATTLTLGGGAEAQVVDLALGLKKRNWDVEIVSMLNPREPKPDLGAEGIPIHILGMRRGVPDPAAILRLRAIIRRTRPDVVHSHMTHANLLARMTRPFARIPVLINTLHGYKMYSVKSNSSGCREFAHRLTDGFTDMTTVVCQAAADRYAEVKAARPGKLLMIPNGICVAVYRPNELLRAQERRRLDLGDEFVWLAAGRLEMVKDYPTMLRAFAESLQADCPQVLLIAGEGAHRQSLEQLAGDLGIADSVRFLGYRADVPSLMRAADGFVQSSMFEGMPLALLEAGASELPVVATRVGGVAETLIEDRTGFLVPARNYMEIGRAMRRIAEMPANERRAMGRSAGDFVRGHYSMEVVLDRWEELYCRLLRQPQECLAAEVAV